MAFKFRDFILGKEIIASRAEFKRTMLAGYLAIICIAISVIYFTLDFLNDVYYAWPAYVILFFVPLVSLILIRNKKYKIAKIAIMVAGNLAVFFAAVNDPFETGAFMYFIVAGIGSFAIHEFSERFVSIALAWFSLVLFMLAYFGDLHEILNVATPSPLYVKISFMVNYFVGLTVAVLIVYFLIDLNRRSEKELMEKEKFANQKNTELQKVNEELDRFVYSVSHDLRSPLSSILGLTDLARRTTDPAELDQLLTMIQGRVKAQDHFISEIIDYSRNVRTELVFEKVNLASLVDSVLETLKFNKHADKIQFNKLVPDDAWIMSDKTRLTVILSNLIANAIKYHDFTKSHPFVEIGYTPQSFTLYVKDNGMGITPEHQHKIFNMFYRASDKSSGSGLGLFITKEAVDKLNGTIEVNSVYGEGSTFTVHLPQIAIKKS